MELSALAHEWMSAKEAESEATKQRRKLEDQMLSMIGVSETEEGAVSAEASGGYKIKISSRMNRKVDSDLAQEIAIELGLTDHLQTLFRWTPALNMAAWKNTDPSITGPLSKAVTTKPGRPSFKIERESD